MHDRSTGEQGEASYSRPDGEIARFSEKQAGYHRRWYIPSSVQRVPLTDSSPDADHLRMDGTDGTIFAIGDCTATSYAPTAQVASQQGGYLARMLAQMAKKDVLEEKLISLETAAANAASEEEKKKIAEETEAAERQLAKVKLRPFHYSHQGSLAYA